ncbi:glycosyltransferase [Cellulomonas fimi]|uniref:Glycosyl transferase group 1 n=1 Tax=Cellulomonas fimi (strain ATCC 484 / DSM 20113 / JCM 1341 / CCUG 24087 / LMG 16345 / NBRC 15513 / NCIMB 8980 / NCTC 7547 / NRS-133) TaxID=590998 RepID=F4H5Y9_CELFA|nr:glycosyltransferase [Cellulomonas fimi]AEE46719.1 glycosyl transferase group 1 [Cellulomonas fimi ATCC 484]NNH07636.1 glycosyltransferase [Cellulomonas fimi]VEH33979.1 Glycosyl transferases group 1 [Cellulomonas fimi]
MRVLLWHVHGSWTTAFVQGPDTYVLPVVPGRGPDGRGRAQTWDWPASAVEVPADRLRDEQVDVVVLQRPRDAELLRAWTGLRAGTDVPAVYVEHNTPRVPGDATWHPVGLRDDVVLVHVTPFNALAWNNGRAPVVVVEHGVVDPGARYTGGRATLAAAVNEPVRRWWVAGTDVLLRVAAAVPLEVHGMGTDQLVAHAPHLAGRVHDLDQDALHDALATSRAYVHPFRWTSLGLSLVEAMTLGSPVLALATTAAPEAVPASAGLVTSDVDALVATARRWLHDPDEARERGAAARAHALAHFGLERFLTDWQHLLKEVTR